MYLVLLFELFSIEKRKIEQCNQIDISSLSSIIKFGQKPTNQIAQYMVEGRRGFFMLLSTSGSHLEGLWVIFGEYSDIVESEISYKCKDFGLDVSRFLYSGNWQVCMNDYKISIKYLLERTPTKNDIFLIAYKIVYLFS